MKQFCVFFSLFFAILIAGCSSSSGSGSYEGGVVNPIKPSTLNRCLGGSGDDIGYSVCVSTDGTVWVTGQTKSVTGADSDVPNTKHNGSDLWLFGIDPKENKIVYNRCFGGSGDDIGYSVCVSTDGTVWVTGETASATGADSDVPNTKHAGADLWLFGIDPKEDKIVYNRCFGGAQYDGGSSVCTSLDGTLWVTGKTYSNKGDGDVPLTKHGNDPSYSNIWLLGIDPTDDTLEPKYNRCFGGTGGDGGNSVCVASDGTVWVTGRTYSLAGPDSDVPATKHGADADLWLLGINPEKEGTPDEIKYNRCFGGTGYDGGNSVCVSPDGTVWVTGEAFSNANDGDVPATKQNGIDVWLLGINPEKKGTPDEIKYNRCFGGSHYDGGNSVCVSPDGTVWVTGTTNSLTGSDIPLTKHASEDLWLFGINPKEKGTPNEIVYNRCFGGAISDHGYSVYVADGTVWVAGETKSVTGEDSDVPITKHAGADLWLLGIDPKEI